MKTNAMLAMRLRMPRILALRLLLERFGQVRADVLMRLWRSPDLVDFVGRGDGDVRGIAEVGLAKLAFGQAEGIARNGRQRLGNGVRAFEEIVRGRCFIDDADVLRRLGFDRPAEIDHRLEVL